MKRILISLTLSSLAVAGLATASCAAPAVQYQSNAYYAARPAATTSAANANAARKFRAVAGLVNDTKALLVADRGRLTPAHQAYLKARINAIRDGKY